MALASRVVVVYRASELTGLVNHHGTRGQVEFFLRSRGRSLAQVQASHDLLELALQQTSAALDPNWRRGLVERADLHRFVFEPEDLVAVVGPDGLVANVAKYLNGQPVIGVDPESGHDSGVLVRPRGAELAQLLVEVAGGGARLQRRTMVRATLDDGTTLDALNEVYLGDRGHQSARYRLQLPDGRSEPQSSSGLLVSTATGATGWAASVSRERGQLWRPALAEELSWYVREAWPSAATGVELTSGSLTAGAEVEVLVQSDELVAFGDGLEADRVRAFWGQSLRLGVSPKQLTLVP
jgi:hypothetical protein